MSNKPNYPKTIAGIYRNEYTDEIVMNSLNITQEQADEVCDAIQKAVGGRFEIRPWSGVSKSGKKLPPYKLEVLTAAQLEERKAFAAKRKAEREAQTAGDDAL